MTLQKLLIQNFQCHSKLKVEFDKNITTITGSSDIGKSAIIRALRWLCHNNPQGEAFIKEGTKGTIVKLIVDGKEIIRKRSEVKNTYHLDGKEFKAFGTDVPDPIINVLNLSDINFQSQHDSVYWFSLSAGEVSRQLNSIVDLGIIDSSLSAIGKKVRHYQQSITICKERLTKAKERKESINWVIEANADYLVVEKGEEKHQELRIRATDLKNRIGSSQTYIEMRDRASSQGKDVQSVGKLGQICLKLSKRVTSLSVDIKNIQEQKKILDIGIPDTKLIISAFEKYNDLSDKVWSLRTNHIDAIKQMTSDLVLLKNAVQVTETDLHEAIEGICPVCGREI